MVPIIYQVVGEEDYALKISIASDGAFTVDSGTYTSEPPRSGQLTDLQEAGLIDAIKQLGIPREHPMPEGATAFEAQLTVGELGAEANYVFWEGALEEDAQLNVLVRRLEQI